MASGPFGSKQAAPNQASITTSDTQLIAANPLRRRVIVHNIDATNPIFVTFGSDAATTAGFRIAKDESVEFQTVGEIRAIATGGTVVTHTWEEFD